MEEGGKGGGGGGGEGRRERELSGNLKWKEEGEVQYEWGEREGRQTRLRE